MIKKFSWALCVYFITLNALFAGVKELAIQMGADAAFNSVVRVRTPQGVATGTLMHVNGNPFFLTVKHGVSRRQGLWIEAEQWSGLIRGVQALPGDMALLFPKSPLPKRLLASAINIESVTSAFSIPEGYLTRHGFFKGSNHISMKGFPNIEGYGAGYGSPLLSWKGHIGLLDWRSPSQKNGFTFNLDGIKSEAFIEESTSVYYNLSQNHTLVYEGSPEKGALNRPLSPGFSGSMVFNVNNQPVGIVTRSLSVPLYPDLTRPNGDLLRHLRRLFGINNLPWLDKPVGQYPLWTCVVHSQQLTAVEPLFPCKDAISLTAQIYYDSL